MTDMTGATGNLCFLVFHHESCSTVVIEFNLYDAVVFTPAWSCFDQLLQPRLSRPGDDQGQPGLSRGSPEQVGMLKRQLSCRT